MSRAYYAMYHAARAVAYVANEGDDHEAHHDLHNGLPDDFPNVAQWRNELKDARLRRNEADYDPYPLLDADFANISRLKLAVVVNFMTEVEAYLRGRGCTI